MTTRPPAHVRHRRQWTWAAAGALLALGAPGGLVVVEAISRHAWPSVDFLSVRLAEDPLPWVYLTISNLVVMVAAGALLGHQADLLQTEALTDPLTRLANRRQFEERLEQALAHARRTGEAVSVLMVDLDRLKNINDEGGHTAGDRALVVVGRRLRGISRKSDVAARIGGDEFALLAPSTAPHEAAAMAERLCEALRAGSPRLTVSIGISGSSHPPFVNAHGLLEAADAALYEAKAGGRDQVRVQPCRCVQAGDP